MRFGSIVMASDIVVKHRLSTEEYNVARCCCLPRRTDRRSRGQRGRSVERFQGSAPSAASQLIACWYWMRTFSYAPYWAGGFARFSNSMQHASGSLPRMLRLRMHGSTFRLSCQSVELFLLSCASSRSVACAAIRITIGQQVTFSDGRAWRGTPVTAQLSPLARLAGIAP